MSAPVVRDMPATSRPRGGHRTSRRGVADTLADVQQRLALFDLDGTLVDRQAAYSDAVAGLCRDHALGPAAEQWLLARLADRANTSDFKELVARFGLAESADRLWQEYADRMAAAVTCRAAILEGLAGLRAEAWTIGIATNGASDIQRAKLAATGIEGLVDGVAVSGDMEIRKPDRRLFELAAERCGLRLADGGWMIGDNPVADIGGGHQAGLHTIWLRGRPWPDALPAAHHTVLRVCGFAAGTPFSPACSATSRSCSPASSSVSPWASRCSLSLSGRHPARFPTP